jgi:hypothetical protein
LTNEESNDVENLEFSPPKKKAYAPFFDGLNYATSSSQKGIKQKL